MNGSWCGSSSECVRKKKKNNTKTGLDSIDRSSETVCTCVSCVVCGVGGERGGSWDGEGRFNFMTPYNLYISILR